MGCDVLVSKKLNFDQIKKLVSSVLEVEQNDILPILGSFADCFDEEGNCSIDYNETPDDSRVLVEVFEMSGDFSMRLEVDYSEDDFKISPLEFAKKMSQIIPCECLVGSDEVNPYHWVLVDEYGCERFVYVDRERLDEHNEFVVSRDA